LFRRVNTITDAVAEAIKRKPDTKAEEELYIYIDDFYWYW